MLKGKLLATSHTNPFICIFDRSSRLCFDLQILRRVAAYALWGPAQVRIQRPPLGPAPNVPHLVRCSVSRHSLHRHGNVPKEVNTFEVSYSSRGAGSRQMTDPILIPMPIRVPVTVRVAGYRLYVLR